MAEPQGPGILWPVLGAFLVGGFLLSLAVGPMGLSEGWVVMRLRLPRALLAVLAGSSLAASGCVLQSILRNELATPYTLGISAGAALAAGALIVSNLVVSSLALVATGTLGALVAVAVVYLLARRGSGSAGVRLLLAGITVNLVGASILMLFEYFSPASRLVEIVRWLMGSLAAVDTTVPVFLLLFVVPGMAIVLANTGTLNQLASGETVAASRGVTVGRKRNVLLIASALLAGGSVGAIGPVGFVGLVVPHIMRKLVGGDYRRLVPASAVAGMVALLLADSIARIVISPAELPIGVVMSLVGGPFFLFLLLRSGRY
ncbi:iron chelate uptake ABC transporter family permease subunit [Candidatus Fermentibacteria bacterium]|nr:iron chelate uptake ABC transporter family permease subunit [Candidatus Fermentibacteria bacterium]